MDNLVFIRDTILQKLKSEKYFNNMVAAELDGNYFSAADIAIPDSKGNCEVYRITVVKHSQPKSFT